MYDFTLTNGALMYLQKILTVPGSLTEIDDMYRAGQIIEDILPKTEETTEQDEAWARGGVHKFQLNDRQRETCRKAIRFAVGKGVVAGHAMNLLIKQFGLAPEV